MRVFVTGGTGLLGNTILRQLTDAGHETMALVRGSPDSRIFKDIKTELVHGDLLDQDVIEQAIAQCDAVIHSAAFIHIGWKRLDESMRVNAQGTRTIVEACLKHGCKLVHVGTVDTLGVGTLDQPGDESTPLDHAGGQVPCNYVVSKKAGVDEVMSGVTRGLRAAIVHPGFMLGPWDWKPSSGRMMLEVGRSWKPIAPSGGCSVCDSRDVAAGTIAAMQADVESGRQYILAGEDMTYRQLWSEMADRMGTRRPILTARPVPEWVAGAAGDLWALIFREGDVNSAAVGMSAAFHWHDSSRARSELGYQNRPSAESLDASADWIKRYHQ